MDLQIVFREEFGQNPNSRSLLPVFLKNHAFSQFDLLFFKKAISISNILKKGFEIFQKKTAFFLLTKYLKFTIA